MSPTTSNTYEPECPPGNTVACQRVRFDGGKQLLKPLLIALMLCAGVSLIPGAGHGFPWSTDMFRGEFVRPLERTPRNQPAGTLAETAIPPLSQSEGSAKLHNPLTPTPQVIAMGRFLFLTTCAPCHGANGRGDGPVLVVLEAKPANLTSGVPLTLDDGAIFATIRGGWKEMPSYGDALTTQETWEVVSYVRKLQGSAAAARPRS